MHARNDTRSLGVIPAHRFSTPAGQVDFPGDPTRQAALDHLWNTNLSGFVAQAITGNPWTSTNTSDQTWYYDPTTTSTASAGYQQITWSPLPGRITYYFPQLASTFDLYSLADTGKDTQGNTFGQITTNPCDPTGAPMEAYGPYGPRGWQDEYCEWSIERNSDGKIVRIDYTCENPEYFNSVWLIDPSAVLAIYQSALGKPQIQLADLYLKDAAGKAVIDPSSGRPAYDPLNKWNNGPISTSTGGGAMHLTSTPNTIQTEMGLASGATTPRPCGNTNPKTLICCAQYGQVGRNSDPNIGAAVNAVVNTTTGLSPAKATLANPPGLYIQTPDFAAYQYTTPDGTDASTFWTMTRGTTSLTDSFGRTLPGTFVLHATFMVPASLGYTISDIQIGGVPIQYASQVSATFLMQIVAQAIPQGSPPAQQPCAGSPSVNEAQPLQLFHREVFTAMYAHKYATVVGVTARLASNSTMIAPWLTPGQTATMVLVLTGVDPRKPPSIGLGDGVTVVAGEMFPVEYAIPGNSYPSKSYAMHLTVTVSENAEPGVRGCYATNPGQSPSAPMPSLLNIVAGSTGAAT